MNRRAFLKFLGVAPAVAALPVSAAAVTPLVMDATPLVAQPVAKDAMQSLMAVWAQTSEYSGSFTDPGVWSRITAKSLFDAIEDENAKGRCG